MDTVDDVKKTAAAKVRAAKTKVTEEAEEAHPAEIWEVRGPEGGRRRAGIRFTPHPIRVDTRDLTRKEAVAIAGDPALSVKVIGSVKPVSEAESSDEGQGQNQDDGEGKPPAT